MPHFCTHYSQADGKLLHLIKTNPGYQKRARLAGPLQPLSLGKHQIDTGCI